VIKELGTGTFGKVFECNDRKYNDKVAVKVVRSIKRYVESALIEASVLDAVYSRQKKERKDFCVKMFSHFNFNDHYCLVFETLGISIYDLIKKNDYTGFPLKHVRDIARQLLGSMEFLESMNLIHTGRYMYVDKRMFICM
jgi:serine/threonine protein kinase